MKIINVKNALSCVLAVVILFAAMPTYAKSPADTKGGQEKSCRGQKNWEKEKGNFMKELGITPEQEAQLKKQRQDNKEMAKALMGQVRAKKQELRQELDKYVSDQGKIDLLAFELKSSEAQLVDLRIAKIMAIKSILTKEQFEKFKDKMKTHFKDKVGAKHQDKKHLSRSSHKRS